jgi:hypothetical protein
MLRDRIDMWKSFESKMEMVKKYVKEDDYMMEMINVKGYVEYERLMKENERLEGIYGYLEKREEIMDELRDEDEKLE